ncbi:MULTISPECIES: biotin transporter BioY [unclassified Sedimentibacter]|uniref:biotin transporter BioY n=1 Tax=unclassified Sedimentibacter TaxID=2649220 RepID=UPI0027E1EC01|nr:biotin transporter BioY [Sedimentibacter sp. MB35-C1]WMJ78901.1 biotin transporter BioY [Sedimentibacter sp. MB35-C1]
MTTMKLTAKDITQIGMFSALTAIGAFLTIPVGPVPITLQSFFVLLSGIMLGSKKAMYSQLVYILLGLAGLPIFSGFSGGLQHVLKPSFGFLIGYIFAAYITGKIAEKNSTAKNLLLAVFAGTAVLYAIGIPYMYYILNIMLAKNFTMAQILNMGMFMFIPGDTLKAAVAVFAGEKIKARLTV